MGSIDSDDATAPAVRRSRRTLVVGAGVLVLAIGGASFALADRNGDRDLDVDAAAAGSDDEAAASDAEREARERAEAEAEAERLAEEEAEEARLAEEAAEAADAERLAEEEREAEEARLAEERAEEERLASEAKAAEEQQQFVDAQARLKELGYLVGAADGEVGQQTTSALMAFQAVNGLAVDGQLGPQTFAALDNPNREPALRGGAANRIEVDMDRQVLHLVEGGKRVTTMKVSTGRGGTFESEAGETLRAETPVGTFTIDRRIAGEKPSSYGIGSMWDPMYFHGPWAIHGSPTVPAGPASSGCVRVAMADGRWLFDRVPNGTPVVLYGGVHVFTP
ncbi:MAG: L,D-transpeptidase family protein [Nitriliruptor sp.]